MSVPVSPSLLLLAVSFSVSTSTAHSTYIIVQCSAVLVQYSTVQSIGVRDSYSPVPELGRAFVE